VLYRTLAGQFVLGRDYSKALKVQRLIKEEHARVLQEVDFLVTPTAPAGVPRIDIYARRHTAPRAGAGGRYAGQVDESQQCDGTAAITVPCGSTRAGLPIGVRFIGRPFDEARLLQVAHVYEEVSPNRGRRPAIVDRAEERNVSRQAT
jgi:aspartyl-tRNA(Asn)/glutamyl-tRNA(Gln) amidotransferase subunit A